MVHPFALLLGAVCLGVVGQLLMKSGMNQVGAIERFALGALLRIFSNPFVILGFASYGISSICYLMALSRLDLSVAYPTAGLGYVMVLLISSVVLREPVTPLRWLGVLLIFAGVWLVGRS
ncbi:MAG: EamA family transporter [Anaerolineae bacterium]|nr:EamA family transporter [Anaerolineae bacterium]